MARKSILAFAALALALAGAATAQEAKPLSVGPLRFDMSLAEIKAAAPATTWEDLKFTTHAKRLVETRGQNAVTLAGMAFDVIAFDSYGTRDWRVKKDFPGTTAAACETRAMTVFAALEPGLTRLESEPPSVRPGTRAATPWNVQRLPGGAMVVSPGVSAQGGPITLGETVQIGAASAALVRAQDAKMRPIKRADFDKKPPVACELFAIGGGEGQPVITYTADFDVIASQTICAIELRIAKRDTRPDERIAFDATKLKPALIGYRHWRASKLAAIPPEGVTIPLSCTIERATGAIRNCFDDPRTPKEREDFAFAAMDIYAGASYDLGDVDKDDPLPAIVKFDGRIEPGDARPIDFLDAPRTPRESLRWRRLPRGETWERLYPTKLKEKGIQASMIATCQIQADYSVICAGARATDQPPEIAAQFAPPIYEAMTWAYAAENKVDGASSVGAVFDLQLAFKLAD